MKVARNILNESLKISEDVIETIVQEAAMEVDGVAKLAMIPISKSDYFLKASKPKAVKIDVNGDTVKITLGLTLRQGAVIKRVAEQVQQQAKEAVQNMTGVAVYQVNVYIAGICAEQE